MRSRISVGERVPAAGGRASSAQMRRQTCLVPLTNAKRGAAQLSPDFVLSELTQRSKFDPTELAAEVALIGQKPPFSPASWGE